MNIKNLIDLATKHVNKGSMVSSAQLCLSDARNLLSYGNEEAARVRAIKSLGYSIGILHTDYQLATAEICEVYNSDDGTTLGGETLNGSYEGCVKLANEWNHSGAPSLFRIRPATNGGSTLTTIPRDRLFTRIKPMPGRSYYCGCDARTDGPEKCRQHDSPRVP